MKTRIILSLDPLLAMRAKLLAHARKTSVSALIETFLRNAPSYVRTEGQPFSRRWAGKFRVASSPSARSDPRLDALKARHKLT